MAKELLLTASFLCGLSGMGWLALSMRTHWSQAGGSVPQATSVPRTLRRLGAIALALSLAACLVADHPSMALLVWVMTMGVSAIVVAMTLAYSPRALYGLTLVARSSRREG